MSQLRYEPQERCPAPVALLSALQIFVPNTVSVILLSTLVVRAGGSSDDYLSWVIFAVVASCGLGSILHTLRLKYFGSGRVVVTNFNVPYLAVCALALDASGPAGLATLIVVSTLLQLVLTQKLASLRRVLTTTVNGTVIMLVAVSAVPFIISHAVVPPEDVAVASFLAPGGAALAVGLIISLRGSALLRMWMLPIMVVVGLVVTVPTGFYDFDMVAKAPWLSLPFGAWPGLDLSFGAEFWTLLPVFVIVNLTAFMKSVGDLSVIYRGSYRKPVAIDYRTVQGGLNVSGCSTVASGLLGTPPVAAPWAVTVVYVNLIGVAARRVGVYLGLITLAAAPLSKLVVALTAIPSPVVSAIYVIIFGMLFIEGAKMAFADQINSDKAAIVGVSIVLGLSAGSLGQLVSGAPSLLAGSSIVIGGMTAVLMTAILDLFSFPRRRLRVDLSHDSLRAVDDFLSEFADRHDWTHEAKNRLRLVGEEIMLSLLTAEGGNDDDTCGPPEGKLPGRKLTADVRNQDGYANLEFIVASEDDMGGNLEDRLAYLGDDPAVDEEQFSARILGHYGVSMRHRKYHGVDIITCRVHEHHSS